MTASRWICIGDIKPETESGLKALCTARELGARHSVLFWDVSGTLKLSGKRLSELVPYYPAFSPGLLRNFLIRAEERIGLLEGPISRERALQDDLFALIKGSFDFILVLTPLTWNEELLALLDRADLLLLIAPPEADDSTDITRHLDELSKHKFPKALAHVLAHDIPGHRLAAQLETDDSLYAITREVTAETARKAKIRVHERLLDAAVAGTALPAEKTHAVLENLIAEDASFPASRQARERVLADLLHDVLGLGPLEPLLRDPEVTEILVNGPRTVFVEKQGRMHPTDVRFENDAQLRAVIDRIVAPIGRRVDESTPLCDARLADGARVNIVLPPLALDGATLTIRKFMPKRLSLDDLIQFGTLNREMAECLAEAVQSRKNILISGGTGSGKTTLLNILSGFISPDERVVTIEDAAELKLQQPHVVRLESRSANAEGEGAIPIRRLVINALRMRPDRIVIGECRGGEALDMLQAMNTGHDGSLTTLHANSPRDALGRLETMVLMAGIDLPIRVIREQVRSAVHFIVQISRSPEGSRKVVSIMEITGMEQDVLTTAELFRFRSGRFEATGLVSQVLRQPR